MNAKVVGDAYSYYVRPTLRVMDAVQTKKLLMIEALVPLLEGMLANMEPKSDPSDDEEEEGNDEGTDVVDNV